MTPSLFLSSIARTIMTKNNHASNPNPQQTAPRYRSMSDLKQNSEVSDYERSKLEMFKFGRRVVFDR
jgi:hypothetical protein